jgi:hypothetical protein
MTRVQRLRIGTWNLAGRWGDAHLAFLLGMECDVLLLTEVNERVAVPGHALHVSEATMAARRRWAGVMVRGTDLSPMDDPHPASAMASSRGLTFCSSILPWRSCGIDPWIEGRHVDKTEAAVATLLESLPTTDLVWGGDWNHALTGREYAGSIGGRTHITEAVGRLGLRVPTTDLAHRIPDVLSIDHIAVPADSTVVGAHRVDASGPPRLSDHDAYVVELG